MRWLLLCRILCSFIGFRSCLLHSLTSCSLGSGFAFVAEIIHLFFGEVLYADKGIRSRGHADELVKLGLNSCSIPILSVLNEEHHQECYNGCAGIDDQLPCI